MAIVVLILSLLSIYVTKCMATFGVQSSMSGDGFMWSEVDVSSTGQRIAAAEATMSPYLWISNDFGASFTQSIALNGDTTRNRVAMSGDGMLIVTVAAGRNNIPLHISTDGGNTFTDKYHSDILYNCRDIDVAKSTGHIVAINEGGGVYISDDNGDSFDRLDDTMTGLPGNHYWLKIETSGDASTIIVYYRIQPGSATRHYITHDRGDTWVDVGFSSSFYADDYAISDDGMNIAIAGSGFSAGSSSNAPYSRDGGSTWQSRHFIVPSRRYTGRELLAARMGSVYGWEVVIMVYGTAQIMVRITIASLSFPRVQTELGGLSTVTPDWLRLRAVVLSLPNGLTFGHKVEVLTTAKCTFEQNQTTIAAFPEETTRRVQIATAFYMEAQKSTFAVCAMVITARARTAMETLH